MSDMPLDSQTVTGTGTYYSPWLFLDGPKTLSSFFEWAFAGTAVGVLTLETTCAVREDVVAGVYGIGPTKYDIGDFASDEAINGNKTSFFAMPGLCVTAARMKYVGTSGTSVWSYRAQSAIGA